LDSGAERNGGVGSHATGPFGTAVQLPSLTDYRAACMRFMKALISSTGDAGV
jgi:hypothetical protein